MIESSQSWLVTLRLLLILLIIHLNRIIMLSARHLLWWLIFLVSSCWLLSLFVYFERIIAILCHRTLNFNTIRYLRWLATCLIFSFLLFFAFSLFSVSWTWAFVEVMLLLALSVVLKLRCIYLKLVTVRLLCVVFCPITFFVVWAFVQDLGGLSFRAGVNRGLFVLVGSLTWLRRSLIVNIHKFTWFGFIVATNLRLIRRIFKILQHHKVICFAWQLSHLLTVIFLFRI